MRYLRIASALGPIVALALILSACGSSSPSPTPAPTTAPSKPAPTAAPSPTAAAKPAAAKPAGGELSAGDIAARAKALTEYSFDFKVNAAGQTISGKSSVKGSKMRQEVSVAGMNSIVLIDLSNKVAYTVLVDQKIATKMDFSQLGAQAELPSDRVGALPANAKLVGTETVDGKSAVVYEVPDSQGQGTSKLWVWAERGVPLKMEVTTAAGKFEMEFSNYKFGSLPDSLFELPAGTQVMDLPAGIPGIPGNLPAPGR